LRDIQGRNFFPDTFLRVGERGILFRGIFSRDIQGRNFFPDTFLRVGERGILLWGIFFEE